MEFVLLSLSQVHKESHARRAPIALTILYALTKDGRDSDVVGCDVEIAAGRYKKHLLRQYLYFCTSKASELSTSGLGKG